MTLPRRLLFIIRKYRIRMPGGLVSGEKSRSFKGEKGSIDQDVVEYGSDELFDKMVKKMKK